MGSLMSFEATIISRRKLTPIRTEKSPNSARATFERYEMSPESIRIPIGR